MATLDDVKRDLKTLLAQFSPKQTFRYGRLGDGAGNVFVNGVPSKSWIRYEDDQSKLSQVYNFSARWAAEDTRVLVGKLNEIDEYEQILYVDWAPYRDDPSTSTLQNYTVARHGETHNIGASDPAWIDLKNILHGLCQATDPASQFVYVGALRYPSGETVAEFAGGAIDLAATIAGIGGGQWLYSLISLTSAGVLQETAGVLANQPVVPTIPTLPADSIPISLLLLTNNMTQITEAAIYDWRVIVSYMQDAIPSCLQAADGDPNPAWCVDNEGDFAAQVAAVPSYSDPSNLGTGQRLGDFPLAEALSVEAYFWVGRSWQMSDINNYIDFVAADVQPMQIDFRAWGGAAYSVVLTINEDGDLLGSGGSVPDIGSTTTAEQWGNIFLASGKDTYPNDDGMGIHRRFINQLGLTVWDAHFRAGETTGPGNGTLTAYAWAGAPFAAPAAANYSYLNEYLSLTPTSGARHFLFDAITVYQSKWFLARISIAAFALCGMRVDDGSDNNYYECYWTATTIGQMRFDFEERVGGGAPAIQNGPVVISGDFHTMGLLCLDTGDPDPDHQGQCYRIAEHGGGTLILAGGANRTWAPSRVGLVFQETVVGTGPSYVDWFHSQFS